MLDSEILDMNFQLNQMNLQQFYRNLQRYVCSPSYLSLMKGRLTKFWIYDAVVIIYSVQPNLYHYLG